MLHEGDDVRVLSVRQAFEGAGRAKKLPRAYLVRHVFQVTTEDLRRYIGLLVAEGMDLPALSV